MTRSLPAPQRLTDIGQCDTEQVPAPEHAVTGCLYEAGFHTTGAHPQGGVALARSIDDARRRLADMLIFCDPTAAAVADITAFTCSLRRPGHLEGRQSSR